MSLRQSHKLLTDLCTSRSCQYAARAFHTTSPKAATVRTGPRDSAVATPKKVESQGTALKNTRARVIPAAEAKLKKAEQPKPRQAQVNASATAASRARATTAQSGTASGSTQQVRSSTKTTPITKPIPSPITPIEAAAIPTSRAPTTSTSTIDKATTPPPPSPPTAQERETTLREARQRRQDEKRKKQEEGAKIVAEKREYRQRYSAASRKYAMSMAALPILLVTSYYLYDRLALGNESWKEKGEKDMAYLEKHGQS